MLCRHRPSGQQVGGDRVGVRREAVNKAAANLKQRQLISYSRGNVSILDRQGLEDAACLCYKIIKAEYDNL